MEPELVIPSNIFQTHKSVEHIERDATLSKCAASWKRVEGATYRFYNDYQSQKFMQQYFPHLFELYNDLPLPVMKADLWRYCVVYVFGGIYADADTELLGDIDLFLQHGKPLVVVPENNTHFCQWVFAAPPKSPALKAVIDLCAQRIRNIDYSYQHFVHEATGPGVFTDGILQYLKQADREIYHYEGVASDDLFVFDHATFHKQQVRHVFTGGNPGGWLNQSDQLLTDVVRIGSSVTNAKSIHLAEPFDGELRFELIPTGLPDRFEFTVEGDTLRVRRTDAATGWGHPHQCLMKRIVRIGPSASNVKTIRLARRLAGDNVHVELLPSPFPDRFELACDGRELKVRRTDAATGWDHPHECKLYRVASFN